jgi:hypothetical protein
MSTALMVRTMDHSSNNSKDKDSNVMKHRDPASKMKARGALRTRPFLDKRKKVNRKAKHKGDTDEPR